MPSINRGRVCNTRYNHGKGYFDDLIIDTHGDSTLVEMVNGGGKSFFVQCLGQTVLPNTKWQNDWEFKEVFNPKNKNNTIHFQTEWILDDNSEYKYLLAGFCGYKLNESSTGNIEGGEEGEIYVNKDFGYFNYICLYNEPNANDAGHMPLREKVNNNFKTMNYKELRKYLGEIKSSDYYTEKFDTIGEYKKRLSQYNITAAEWEIIRGVNADEKYSAAYFRKYKTSKEFILDFLIPIIEECNSTQLTVNYQDSEALATSLLEIKDQLNILMKKKSQSAEYKYLIESIKAIADNLKDVKNLYAKKESINLEIESVINFLKNNIDSLDAEIKSRLDELTKEDDLIKDITKKTESLNIIQKKNAYEELNKQVNKDQEVTDELEKQLKDLKADRAYKKAENNYIEYLKDIGKKQGLKEQLSTTKKDNSELVSIREDLSKKAKTYLNNKIEEIKLDIEVQTELSKEVENEISNTTNLLTKSNGEIIGHANEIHRLVKEEKSIKTSLSSEKFGTIGVIEKNTKSIDVIQNRIEELSSNLSDMEKKIINCDGEIKEFEKAISSCDVKDATWKEKNKCAEEEYVEAKKIYEPVNDLLIKYDTKSTLELKEILNKLIENHLNNKRTIEGEIASIKDLIISLEEHTISLSDDTYTVFKIIERKFSSAILGAEFIKSETIANKKYFIEANELIPYGILLNKKDYEKAKLDEELFSNYYGSAVPIINYDTLDEPTLLSSGMYFTIKHRDFFVNEENTEKVKIEKENLLKDEEDKLHKIIEEIEIQKALRKPVERFLAKYENNENTLLDMEKLLEKIKLNIANINSDKKANITLLNTSKKAKSNLGTNFKSKNQEIKYCENQLDLLNEYLKLEGEYLNTVTRIEEVNKLKINSEENNKKLNNLKKELVTKEKEVDGKLRYANQQNYELNQQIKEYSTVEIIQGKITDKEYEEFLPKLEAVKNSLSNVEFSLKKLESSIRECEERLSRNKEEIEGEDFTLDQFNYITIVSIPNSYKELEDLKNNIKEKGKEFVGENTKLGKLKEDRSSIQGVYLDNKQNFKDKYPVSHAEIMTEVKGILEVKTSKELIEELKNNEKNSVKRIGELKNKNKILESKKREKEKDFKAYEDLANRENIKINVRNINLDNYRDIAIVTNELSATNSNIDAKIKHHTRKLEEISAKTQYIKDFSVILNDLKIIPTDSKELEGFILKLIGSDSYEGDSLLYSLEEELVKIQESINALEEQEENFITLCIQKSVNIYRDLKKLTDLSVIEINGVKQAMLEVKLNRLSEDVAYEKMKNYIEALISNVESNENNILTPEERKQTLMSGLTITKLFMQIIDSIKADSIKIFKLEDIDNIEKNEWLSWNKAYGSKGQTNGMYICVLICIISYIRKLYTVSTENQKKVLILDNPFAGTTSEILWLPILNLMKENHIQLIAVGYEVKSQLADTFKTRYYLTKEKTGTNETTTIEDFKSAYSIEKLPYDSLTGNDMKQMDLFS